MYSNEVVCAPQVQFGKDASTFPQLFQGGWDQRKWAAERDGLGLKPPSFLPTKKKLDVAGEVNGLMNFSLSALSMYSSMAFHG